MFKTLFKTPSIVKYLTQIDRRWLIIWCAIYVGFLSFDTFFPGFFGGTILKYTGIVLCLVYAYQKFRSDNILIIALSFTLLADTVLVINSTSIIGVFVFILAQFSHIIRLTRSSPKLLAIYVIFVILAFFSGVLLKADPMYLLATIYAAALLFNLFLSYRWYKSDYSIHAKCAFFGFILFICCDLCVAISYLSGTSILPAYLHPIANYFAWVFYYPSQILICNSSRTVLQ